MYAYSAKSYVSFPYLSNQTYLQRMAWYAQDHHQGPWCCHQGSKDIVYFLGKTTFVEAVLQLLHKHNASNPQQCPLQHQMWVEQSPRISQVCLAHSTATNQPNIKFKISKIKHYSIFSMGSQVQQTTVDVERMQEELVNTDRHHTIPKSWSTHYALWSHTPMMLQI